MADKEKKSKEPEKEPDVKPGDDPGYQRDPEADDLPPEDEDD